MSSPKMHAHWLEGKGKVNSHICFGRHIAYWLYHSPRRMMHSMTYYKFASRMIGSNKRVLDIGCGEGLGTWLLAAECGEAEGVDNDEQAIATAKSNWNRPCIRFECIDIFKRVPRAYDGIVSFDVIEHLTAQQASLFLGLVAANLAPDGVAIIGTPNVTGQPFASKIASMDHVILYSGEQLENELRIHFKHVFMFAANDEVVHTGFLPMAHYLIAVACFKKSDNNLDGNNRAILCPATHYCLKI